MDIRRGLVISAVVTACTFGLGCATPDETDAPTTASEAVPEPMPTAPALPPTEATAPDRLNSSPRHGEWVDVTLPGSDMPVSTWVVYPERAGPAPVLLVIHEIFGLTDWVRGVADQFAAEGFIAVAPDLLSGMGPDGGGTASLGGRDNVVATIRTLEPGERARRLDAVRLYALDIPAGNGRIGSVGFCWGGTSSFAYAASQPALDAAVVYYGTSPEAADEFAQIVAPVLGHYGEDDERVNSTIPRAEEAMVAGQSFESNIYAGSCGPKTTARARIFGPRKRRGRARWSSSASIWKGERAGHSGSPRSIRGGMGRSPVYVRTPPGARRPRGQPSPR